MQPTQILDVTPGAAAALIFCLLFLWATASLWGMVAQLFDQWRVERVNKRAKVIGKAIDKVEGNKKL